MKKMLINQKELEKKIYIGRYVNGQLAVFVHDHSGEPIAELSIMEDSIELAPDEFILKEYSENKELVQEYINTNVFSPADRLVLVGSYLCPICQISS
ncbi:MAG: hypothetical protein ACFFBV_12775 [Promethearchaeota archaeon]